MICYDRQCIFVHIPKTAGTSIENAIWGSDWSHRTEKNLWMGAVRPGFNKYQSGGLQHLLSTQIRQEVGKDTFDSFYKFSFVRNPWDKVVSQFCYIKTRRDLMRFIGMSRWSSFGRYLELICRTPHVQSFEQWRFILDNDDSQLVNFVGRFENIAVDFLTVAKQLKLPTTTLPHDMKSKKRKPYQTFYNRATKKKVAEIYAKDIELFGYSFE